jgi:hypothetical protein
MNYRVVFLLLYVVLGVMLYMNHDHAYYCQWIIYCS